MTRSLSTLAITDAAIIDGTLESPLTTHRWGMRNPSMGTEPSTRTSWGLTGRAITAIPMAQREAFSTWVRSILPQEAAWALHWTFRERMASKRASRLRGRGPWSP